MSQSFDAVQNQMTEEGGCGVLKSQANLKRLNHCTIIAKRFELQSYLTVGGKREIIPVTTHTTQTHTHTHPTHTHSF